jgi:hypothetical protein
MLFFKKSEFLLALLTPEVLGDEITFGTSPLSSPSPRR